VLVTGFIMLKVIASNNWIKPRNFPKSLFLTKTTQMFLDLSILCVAFLFAYLLRFDFPLTVQQTETALLQMLFIAPFQLLILRIFKVHKFIWRYVSISEMNRVLQALLIATLPILLIRFSLYETYRSATVPLSIIIFDFCLAFVGILGIRLFRRAIYDKLRHFENVIASDAKKAVLLVGAGRAGVMTLAEIKSRQDIDIDVKGFVDDDDFKKGSIINGVKILGNTEQLETFVRELNIDHIIISIAQATREDFQRILNICRNIPIKVRTIPALYELLQEKVCVSRIRDIEIEDLLGRSPIQLEKNSIKEFLQQKSVMVTGAGGSIGSELVRQLIHCQPDELILVERSEFALFQIEREIAENFPDINFVPVIGDICDKERMTNVFRKYRPQVIFHAAAHKHVPMMETNTSEALKNNILGTNTVGLLAGRFDAEAFVLISTDKAVNSTSVMGATKRFAEIIVQELNSQFDTRFVSVRFGNVIGSNGSVIPNFEKQIRKGGPVTVTHPDMERFFMTIPEASQLVLQAGAIGAGGEIFVLDMGKPVKIFDLARETIRLSGLEPDKDIEIIFTGIRPGEKLFEELVTDKVQLEETMHSKISVCRINPYPHQQIVDAIAEIENLCYSEDDILIRNFLSEFIPEAKLEYKVPQPMPEYIQNQKQELYQSATATA
jgi:FlaA1/EpsC-like NDP-sugar epimerase